MSSKVLRRGLLKGAGRLFDGAAPDELGQPKRQLKGPQKEAWIALEVASKGILRGADPYCTTLAGFLPITDYSSHTIQRGFCPRDAGMATDIAA